MEVSSVFIGSEPGDDFISPYFFLQALPNELDKVYKGYIRAGTYEDFHEVSSANTTFSEASCVHLIALDRHKGFANSGVVFNSSSGDCLDIYNPYTVIDGIQVSGDGTNLAGVRFRNFNSSTLNVTLRNMVFKGFGGNNANGITLFATSSTLDIENCLFFNCNRAGLYVNQNGGGQLHVNLRNCTFYNCGRSGTGAVYYTCNNSISIFTLSSINTLIHTSTGDNSVDDDSTNGTQTYIFKYCATSDNSIGSLSSTGSTGNLVNQAFGSDGELAKDIYFENIVNEDFHLVDNGSNNAVGAGTTLRPLVQTDMSDDWRPEPYDIGADHSSGRTIRKKVLIS